MKTLKRKMYAALQLAVIVCLTSALMAQENSVTVGDIGWGEVDIQGFTLLSDAEVTISGEGGYLDEWHDDLLYYCWILNSSTREVIWSLIEDSRDFSRNRREGIFRFEEKLDLEAGDYEIYYTGMYDRYDKDWDLGDFFGEIFGSDRSKRRSRRDKDLSMTVSSSKLKANSGLEIVDKMSHDAVVSFVRMEDDEYEKKSFELTRDVELSIYALGEGRRREAYDYGWIYDELNHKKVWEMNPRYGSHAGGGSKNVLVEDNVTLPKGVYTVHYVTDDSHSFREWNVLPPYDPQFWGISIWVENDDDMQYVKEDAKIKSVEPVVELIKARDDEYFSQGIKVSSPVEVRILCLGEGGNRKTMADYGWITNADTREIVWEMEWRKTDHAGGADKNRMVDEVITMQPGNYVVYYSTDDSHSYRDWNSSPPYDRERWGITIWTTVEEDKKKISLFDESDYQSDKIIVEIIRVRDDEYQTETFTLKNRTRIRIFALGEGDERDGYYSRRKRGEMFDFGWIENEKTGRIVWDMTYDKTDHAGGAKKNRIFNGVIELDAGTYILCYETDGSHSYRDWNTSPPHDWDRYGITIYKE